nr:MAG TPA_asm: hypothetical protein [Caudoviricetes sp.]
MFFYRDLFVNIIIPLYFLRICFLILQMSLLISLFVFLS